MPNINSKAAHRPQRTCVVCKKKIDASSLLNFCFIGDGVVFDVYRRLQTRKNYLCPNELCIEGLETWIKRYHKRRISANKNRKSDK